MEEGIRDLKKKEKKKPYNLRNEIIVLYQNKRIVPFYNSLKVLLQLVHSDLEFWLYSKIQKLFLLQFIIML